MTSPAPRRLMVGVTLILMLATLLPVAEASFGVYGSLAADSTNEPDVAGLLLVDITPTIRYVDEDQNNNPSSGDDYYLDITGSAVSTLDIFLSGSNAGRQVKSTDSSFLNDALITTNLGGWAYLDENADGRPNLGEPFFLDANNDLVANVGDILVIGNTTSVTASGSRAWTTLTTNSGYGYTLTDLDVSPGGYTYGVMDLNGDGTYGIDDAIVIDVDNDNMMTPGDIRLTDVSTGSDGTMAKPGELMVVHELTTFANAPFLSFEDTVDDDNIADGEPIYLDMDRSNTVTVNDILLGPVSGSSSTSSNAGKQMVTGDSALTNALDHKGHLRFYDSNTNGILDDEDDVYVDITNSSTNTVQVGDLKIGRGSNQGIAAGARVQAGSATDLGRSLLPAGGGLALSHIKFLDFQGGGQYGLNDAVYLDANITATVAGDGLVTPGDFRIGKGASPVSTFGQAVDYPDTDAEPCYRFNFDWVQQLGWVDESNAAVVGLTEPVYFDRTADSQVTVFDVRISGASSFTAGTFVETSHSDKNNPLTAMTGRSAENAGLPFKYYDANGDSTYSLGTTNDAVYLDVDGSNTITVGDVRITRSYTGSFTQGSRVQSGNADVNGDLNEMPEGIQIYGFDADGDGDFTAADEVYLNVDNTSTDRPANSRDDTGGGFPVYGCITPGDVRLSGSGGSAAPSDTGGGGTGGNGGSGTSNAAPVARITCTAEMNSFRLTFSGASSTDQDGSISTYDWEFGDGTTGTGVQPIHTYQDADSYTVRLVVGDNSGSTRATTMVVKVPTEQVNCAPIPPSPSPTPTDSPTESPTESPTGSPTDEPTDTPTTSPTGDGEDGEDTPAPGVLFALAAMGVALLLHRRRR